MEEIIKVEDVEHSIYGASGSDRTYNCTGSPNEIKKVPENLRLTSEPAAEGTAAHHIASLCLDNNQDAWEYIGTGVQVENYKFVVDKEMADGVQLYVDFVLNKVEEYRKEYGVEPILHVETTFETKRNDELYGTSDATIIVPDILICVTDFKYGRGVSVEPDSFQNHTYAGLALENQKEFNTKEYKYPVDLYIVQPRIPHSDGLIRLHSTNSIKVGKWFDEYLEKIEESKTEKAILTVGEWCRFCPARELCPARKAQLIELGFEIEPEDMTSEEMGSMLNKEKLIEDWFKKVKEVAFSRAMSGEDIPGRKIVKMKSDRIWIDGAEKTLIEEYGDNAYQDRKIKSPPNIEKLIGGKALVKDLADRPERGLTLVALSDRRKPIKSMLELEDEQHGKS